MTILYLKLTVITVSFVFVIAHESCEVFIFLYKWGKWGPERLGNFPEPHSLVNLPDRIKANPWPYYAPLFWGGDEMMEGLSWGRGQVIRDWFPWKEAAGTSGLEGWGAGKSLNKEQGLAGDYEQRKWNPRQEGRCSSHLLMPPTPLCSACDKMWEISWAMLREGFYSNFFISFRKESTRAMHLLYLCD